MPCDFAGGVEIQQKSTGSLSSSLSSTGDLSGLTAVIGTSRVLVDSFRDGTRDRLD